MGPNSSIYIANHRNIIWWLLSHLGYQNIEYHHFYACRNEIDEIHTYPYLVIGLEIKTLISIPFGLFSYASRSCNCCLFLLVSCVSVVYFCWSETNHHSSSYLMNWCLTILCLVAILSNYLCLLCIVMLFDEQILV